MAIQIEYADDSRTTAIRVVGEDVVKKLEEAGLGVVYTRHAAYVQLEQAKSKMDQQYHLEHIVPYERARQAAAGKENGGEKGMLVIPGGLSGPMGM